jgi:hypothetical protein
LATSSGVKVTPKSRLKSVPMRGHPLELPAHAPAKALDLRQRRARDGHEGDVTMRQVNVHAVAVVGHEGAARAALLPPWGEHEVLHQQLAPPFEQLAERAPTLGRVEDVALVDAHPRQRAALAGDLVAQGRQLLFAREQRLALGNPFVPGYDAMILGARLGDGGSPGYVRRHCFVLLAWGIRSLVGAVGGSHDTLSAGYRMVRVTSVSGFRWTR